MRVKRLKEGERIGDYPYEIRKALSVSGNMADVYIAVINKTYEEVVLKISKAGINGDLDFNQDTILNEAAHLSQLGHPGIVQILPVETSLDKKIYSAKTSLLEQSWFLVLEYLKGESLAELVQKNKMGVEIQLALNIAYELAATLDYLEWHDLVHLDIKPQNILFRSYDDLKPVLIDFGIARYTGQQGLEARTALYVPPERQEITTNFPLPHPSMDIYSLGIVIYETLTGRAPNEFLSNFRDNSPLPPSTYNSKLNDRVDRLILSMVNHNPSERPSARQLCVQIRELQTHMGIPSIEIPQAQLISLSKEGESIAYRLNSSFAILGRFNNRFSNLQQEPLLDLSSELGSEYISRTHAEIVYYRDKWQLRHLSKTNHTIHVTKTSETIRNSEVLSYMDAVDLRLGDEIHLGPVKLLFCPVIH